MTKLIVSLATVLSLAVCAQAITGATLQADIPFEFTMGQATLPAGHYQIEVGPGQAFMTLRDGSGHGAAILPVPGTDATSFQQPSLMFHKYGDRYFLSQVQTTNSRRMIPENRAERELARAASPNRTQIVIAMR